MVDAHPSAAATPLDPAARRQLAIRRVVQFSVDFTITALLCLVPLGLMWWLVPRSPDGTMKLLAGFVTFCVVLLACVVIGFAYWVWMPGRDRAGPLGGGGSTPAMRWFRLRVVDQTGARAGRTQLALRWLLLLVDGIALGLVGVAAMLMTPRAQRIGDLMAGTVVILDHRATSARGRAG